ncbi:MAG: class II D-tagatose-bisphosphate aldolase, non-catalytic subunit [Floccifex porci]|uniref:Class II D-tagatose-bisphosphate aldolase, non-catalytic subunit n=1 Tax=Floccifex porci TaxID=2606629 RepID=A0A7X2N1N4_9FIRM|nr:class II D-tagatose-bisphosphate aldolase, non-catalytic subunit [Floccifex porci]MCI7802739.1 class II D-tagatose-bisphosphate aldolase, non-catalytic subunit [Erysipelotrichaceae bacterium]MDD7466517.1 class II D-tagatose-bisphosphate aldolase, non-catalytic subunit [Floccifex porci]MDY4796607.1 class II D-tagatose-bisphosphate aldolase, non-catalytic subunit [Floccifex porci]MSS00806.1 class II D-tagatose-bisphosphate aldolase, non-catalytic subunit [Floccifex porci]
MQNPLKQIVKAQKEGRAVGIYSCCSANEYVIRAALLKGKKDNSCVLIESTANQCDQYGGYTGMKPADFKAFVEDIAKEIGFDTNKLFLGGDHLGPLTFTSMNEEEAMKEADELIRCYVSAGFTKIHIDTSMRVKDDDVNTRLSDETIARRGARLAKVAEEAYAKLLETNPDAIEPVYIVGSEVPIPGGAQGAVDEGVQVTKPEDFKATLNTFEKAFKDNGLDHAWSNVIGIVVQPGVEEKDSGCTEYDRAKAVDLCAAIRDYDNIVFEGHSTDYQTKIKLREMVEDGIAILKVGPGFTFMMRQALFALADIENELLKDKASHFKDVLDAAMLKDTKYWSKHYIGTEEEVALKRKYSFSDRCRYYMPVPEVKQAMQTMIQNLRTNGIPLNLLTQYMPIQYTRVREGLLENDPEALIVDRICDSIDEYLYATHQSELF